VQLSDIDRSVYETLSLKVARHPSETIDYLVTRVLAYCLEYAEGIEFTKGLYDPDEPALWVKDLTGVLKTWIEIGAPDADRLHKASKASPRVVIYTQKDPATVLRHLEGKKVHRAAEIPLYSFDRAFLKALCEKVDKRTILDLSVTERQLYATVGGKTLEGKVQEDRLEERT
jgi:uncharacterized protein YaeQ